MLVPGALLWLVSGNYVLACVWVVILSLVGGAAYLLRTMPLWMWLIMPLVSYVISLAAVGHALRALASLIFFPAAFALHNSISTAKSRTGSIAMTAAALLLSFVATGAIALYMANGHLSMDTIQTTISDYRNLFQTQIQETLDSQIEMMSGMGYDLGVSSAQLAENLVTTLFNYIPGILILTTLVIGWCVQPMPFLLHQRIDPEAPVPVTARVLTFSPVTGIVYMISQSGFGFTRSGIYVRPSRAAPLRRQTCPGFFVAFYHFSRFDRHDAFRPCFCRLHSRCFRFFRSLCNDRHRNPKALAER